MSITNPTIAILGSGPSGCYSAQFLRKKWPNAEITVFESLPVPYGLLRYGVATDHQGTKAIAAQFDRIFERENVMFVGNVTIGADISFKAIAESFDIVIRATGLRHDRSLTVDRDPTCEIVGAGAVLKALNGYPHLELPKTSSGSLAPLGSSVAVIGNGNVAMDVIRLLSKPMSALGGSDIDDTRLQELRPNGIQRIDILGRSCASNAKFDVSMLKEVLVLPNVRVSCTGLTDEDSGKAVEALILAQASAPIDAEVDIHFHFGVTPTSVTKQGNVVSIELSRGCNESQEKILVHTIISATGFTNISPYGKDDEEAQWEGSNVFKVGWLNRDGKGAIAENRKDAKGVVDLIAQQFESGSLSNSKPGFKSISGSLIKPIVDFSGWKKIDNYERSNADNNRCRKKVTNLAKMIAIAHGRNNEKSLQSFAIQQPQ